MEKQEIRIGDIVCHSGNYYIVANCDLVSQGGGDWKVRFQYECILIPTKSRNHRTLFENEDAIDIVTKLSNDIVEKLTAQEILKWKSLNSK